MLVDDRGKHRLEPWEVLEKAKIFLRVTVVFGHDRSDEPVTDSVFRDAIICVVFEHFISVSKTRGLNENCREPFVVGRLKKLLNVIESKL